MTKEKMKTKEKLAQALREAKAPAQMIVNAEAGYAVLTLAKGFQEVN